MTMKLFSEIQNKLGFDDKKMSQLVNLNNHARFWRAFKRSKKRIGIANLYRLYKVSEMSALEFMERLGKEIK